MTNSWWNLVNNLDKEIHKIKFKHGHDDKKCETCWNKYTDCDCFLEYSNFKHDLLVYKYLCCNKSYEQKFYGKLKEQFFKT